MEVFVNARLQYRLIVVPGMCASKVDLSSRLGVCVASKYLPTVASPLGCQRVGKVPR